MATPAGHTRFCLQFFRLSHTEIDPMSSPSHPIETVQPIKPLVKHSSEPPAQRPTVPPLVPPIQRPTVPPLTSPPPRPTEPLTPPLPQPTVPLRPPPPPRPTEPLAPPLPRPTEPLTPPIKRPG
jgi:hypothetical protein